MQNIIHHSQKCVKGRKITENIHLAQDLVDAIFKNKSNAAYIFIDQEKAFDRISHQFLFKTLERYGFGENFIKWIKIIYSGVTSRVKVNGFLTETIDIRRGVRQGCPLSALLYVLCAEVLTTNIRKNENIKGFMLNNSNEHKESMYADDMKVCVTTEESIHELFKLFKLYESATNSKINQDKTEAMWLGNWIGREDTPLGLKWTSGEIKFLGVYVGNNRALASQRTFEEIIEKLKNKLSYWNSKHISKKGKIRILNIYGLTKLWYALEIHNISNSLINEINHLIKNFIWNGYHQRPLSVLNYPIEKGGLALQSIEAKIKTLRIRWLGELLTCEHLGCERSIVNMSINNVSNTIIGLDILKYVKNYENYIDSDYYRFSYNIWRKNNIVLWPSNFNSIKNDSIYHNQLLTDDDNNIFKPPNHNSDTLPRYYPQKFSDLPVQVPIGDLRGVFRSLIPKINVAFYKIEYSALEKDLYQIKKSSEDDWCKLNGPFKDVYSSILSGSIANINIWETKWEADFGGEIPINWELIWACVHSKLLNYKVQSSVWEMIHRNYICGYILKQMNRGDGLCKLCKIQEHKRTHIFMNCTIINDIYQYFYDILVRLGPSEVNDFEKAFGLCDDLENCKYMLRNYITFTIRHIVFRNRNIEFAPNSNVKVILINKIKYFLKLDLLEKFNIYKFKNNLEVFSDVFLVENVIGKIENDKLVILI